MRGLLFIASVILCVFLIISDCNNNYSVDVVRGEFKKMYPHALKIECLSKNHFNPDVWIVEDSNHKNYQFYVYGNGVITKDPIVCY